MSTQISNTLYSYPYTLNTDWQRPSDWPVYGPTSTYDFCALTSNLADYMSFEIQAGCSQSNTVNIDWGDGTPIETRTLTNPAGETFSVIHYYSATASTGTTCSEGYKTFVVRIWPDRVGTQSTSQGIGLGAYLQTVRPYPVAGAGSNNAILGFNYGIPLHELVYGDDVGGFAKSINADQNGTFCSFATTLPMTTTSRGRFLNLKYVKLPQYMWGSPNFYQAFAYTGIAKIDMPLMLVNGIGSRTPYAVNVNCAGMFLSQETSGQTGNTFFTISMPQGLYPTDFSHVFYNCYNLRTINLRSDFLKDCTTLQNAFYNCYSLKSMILPSTPLCVTYNSAFAANTSLEYFEFGDLS